MLYLKQSVSIYAYKIKNIILATPVNSIPRGCITCDGGGGLSSQIASTIFLSTGTRIWPEDFKVLDRGVHWSLENSLGSTPTLDPTGNVLASQAP